MRYSASAISAMAFFLATQLTLGQESDDVAQDDLMTFDEEEIEVIDREAAQALGEGLDQIRITVYRDAGYGGFTKTFYASQGARIDLKPSCSKLNNDISSIIVRGPRGTSTTVYDKSLCYNCTTHSGTFWAYNGEGRIDKPILSWLGVHDRITRIYLQFDGYLLNDMVNTPSC